MLDSPLLYSGRQRRLRATISARPSGHSELTSFYLCSSLVILYAAIEFSHKILDSFFVNILLISTCSKLASHFCSYCLLFATLKPTAQRRAQITKYIFSNSIMNTTLSLNWSDIFQARSKLYRSVHCTVQCL